MSGASRSLSVDPYPIRMSDTKRNYELAFHINPNLEEPRISQIKTELEQQVISGGGVISFTKEPERTRLSYEINHHANAFFGHIHFSAEQTEGLVSVEEYIKLNPEIIRSMIIRLPSDSQKNQAIMRQAKARERLEKAKAAARRPAGHPSADVEKLDKELEDIIEKL